MGEDKPREPGAEELQRAALDRARRLIADRRQSAQARARVLPALTIGGLLVVALALTHFLGDKPRPPQQPPASKSCDRDDSACLGAQIIAMIQEPCSRALEAQLQFPPSWDDSAWQRRFDRPSWYHPPTQLIFHGGRATVRNALGVELKPAYFCVVTTAGTVVKTGIPDLP